MTLLEWLIARHPTAKRQTLRRMVREGRVALNGVPARSVKQEVKETDQVRLLDRVEPPKASIRPLAIVHEDEDILVVNKPAGLLTSTVARERRPTAIAIVRAYLADREPRARAGIIHRLDRDASGLLVFSKNNEAYESLKGQFYRHTVERIYSAIVHGHPSEKAGRIHNFLVELPDGSVRPTHGPDKGEEAVTDYKVIGELGDVSLLRVTLQTGRKHQIRAHLSQRGVPVVGDSVYGPEKKPRVRLMLAATRLAIDHPRTGQRMAFEIPLPPEFRQILDHG